MTAIKFENYPRAKVCSTSAFNVTDFHCKDMKIVKNDILASTSILSFWGREMIKIPGLCTDSGYFS